MIFNNKKGAAQLWWILMVAFIAIVAGILIMLWFRGGGEKLFGGIGEKIDEFGDCDKDRVSNMFDKCPCLSTKGSEMKDLRGCPQGTTIERAEWDRQTCNWLVPIGGDPENPAKECPDNTGCKSRCEIIGGVVEAVPESAGQGVATQGDLQITKFTAGGKSVGEKYNKDLAGTTEFEWIEVKSQAKNKGEETITKNFKTSVFVCDATNHDDCVKKNLYESDSPTSTFVPNLVTTHEMDNVNDQIDYSKFVKVGEDGDACDGPNIQECWLKIRVDSENDLAEKEETNNEKGINVVLKNQKFELFQFESFKSIELVINDDLGPNPEQKPITQMCRGYIGDASGYDCSSLDNSCGDGDFPKSATWNPENNGCLIVVSEDDPTTNDCGYAGAGDEVIISHNSPKLISNLKTSFVTTTLTDAAENAMAYSWKSTSAGSLICQKGVWKLCNPAGNNKQLKFGNKFFKCESRRWIPK